MTATKTEQFEKIDSVFVRSQIAPIVDRILKRAEINVGDKRAAGLYNKVVSILIDPKDTVNPKDLLYIVEQFIVLLPMIDKLREAKGFRMDSNDVNSPFNDMTGPTLANVLSNKTPRQTAILRNIGRSAIVE